MHSCYEGVRMVYTDIVTFLRSTEANRSQLVPDPMTYHEVFRVLMLPKVISRVAYNLIDIYYTDTSKRGQKVKICPFSIQGQCPLGYIVVCEF